MKVTLIRLAGIGAASAVLAAGTLAATASPREAAVIPQSATAHLSTAAVAPLTPAQLTYASRSWGDPATEVGIVVSVPKDWNQTRLALWEAKFTSPNKLWNVRIAAGLSGNQSLNAAAAAKVAALRATPGYRFISQAYGQSAGAEDTVLRHVTLTYSYTDATRGNRLVINRWINVYSGSGADVEISTGGRPQDQAGLAAVTAEATRTQVRLP